MKKHIFLLGIICCSLLGLLSPSIAYANDTNTDLEMQLDKSTEPKKDQDNDKEQVVPTTPSKNKATKTDTSLFPQTGELLFSFLLVLIGLNILLLVVGIIMFKKAFKKYSYNNYGVYS